VYFPEGVDSFMSASQTDLGYVNHALDLLNTYWNERLKKAELELSDGASVVLFMSIGNADIRARVHHVMASNLEKAIDQLRDKAVQLVRKNHVNPQWIKFDFVTDIQKLPFETLVKQIAKTRRNYFRSGIAFDADFRLAFLEQEINGNAMIRSVNKGPLQLNEKNINHYLNTKPTHTLPFMKKHYVRKHVFTFQTESVFIDRDDGRLIELYHGQLTNGIRRVEDTEAEIKKLIAGSTYFLQRQVKDDGQFEYGYFSAFAKRIGTYNILRHCSILYSMVEGYECIRDTSVLETVQTGIDYAIRESMVYRDPEKQDIAFMVDEANHREIKLGASATAILAMAKYMEVTGTTNYLQEARALARGIIEMKTLSGGFIHVLSYPSFEIKALHRIIYYEGEAVFALLRLYALDQDDVWLEEAQKSLDYFIANDYWKHNDHWLSYASNEITDYIPEDKYFEFGLRNCDHRLDFIYHRDTTYPTFLELTMAAYKLVQKVKELGKTHLLAYIDDTFLEETIDRRAEYQRVGYFYPEVAMYMKKPSLVLNGFFVRHHAFRVRIDDIEHYLSGYCQYLQYRWPNVQKPISLTNV